MTDAGWDDLKLFLHVASEGALSGAAARTGLSAPTIGRRMLALERTTGRTLFVRSQQGYRLAPDGETLLEHVRAMQKTADGIADWNAHGFAMPIVSIGADAGPVPALLQVAAQGPGSHLSRGGCGAGRETAGHRQCGDPSVGRRRTLYI
jgi:DNA-binding transcriptional LysR family regulator